ncbi:replication factor C subunit 1 [Nematocida major]|uniref:replication factor C subunit 1 n=1 Tax=Nematocida major TaxID=1912982 RepID=UPI002008002B|nr:replication factor C subunit 1 [Nematocida major]KAH9386809.1 replication factor C subunit 1 [Nematocida major]
MKRKENTLPFEGQTFVVTGTTNTPRNDLVNRIRELGGKVTLSVSGTTSYLVVGSEPGPAKVKKAAANKTRILTEEEFINISKDHVVTPAEVKRSKPAQTRSASKERWTEKYQPKKSSDILGNRQSIAALKEFMSQRDLTPVLISGTSGIGKTLSIYLVAKELGISVVEYNGADCRNKQEMSVIKSLSTQKSLTCNAALHSKKIILLEEIENMGASDRGGLQEMLDLFKKSKTPIVLTVNDKSSQNIKTILTKCKAISYSKIDSRQIAGHLKKIAEAEGIGVPENTLLQIAITACGDVRYATNMLQYLSKKPSISMNDIKVMSKHSTSDNLFDITKEIFQPNNTPAQKINFFFQETAFALLMVFENYLGGGSVQEIAANADSLSAAEVLSTRMIEKDEKRLFPVAAYYTTVRPKLRLAARVMFSRQLGMGSTISASKKKLGKILAGSQERGAQGGWSVIYELYCIMKMLSREAPPAEMLPYIQALKIDKNILQVLSDVTGVKLKPGKLPLLKVPKE